MSDNTVRVRRGWRFVRYNTVDRTRQCFWCREWIPECEMHKPHFVEFRRRRMWNIQERPITKLWVILPVGGRCPIDMRRLVHLVNRDIARCPSQFCDYAIDGLTLHNRTKSGIK